MEKKRGIIKAKKDISENELIDEIQREVTLTKYLKDKKIRRKIYISGKLINIII